MTDSFRLKEYPRPKIKLLYAFAFLLVLACCAAQSITIYILLNNARYPTSTFDLPALFQSQCVEVYPVSCELVTRNVSRVVRSPDWDDNLNHGAMVMAGVGSSMVHVGNLMPPIPGPMMVVKFGTQAIGWGAIVLSAGIG
jgi:hypothetical protein